MVSWNLSLLIGVTIVFLIFFFWDFLIGRDRCDLRLHPIRIVEIKNIKEGLRGFL